MIEKQPTPRRRAENKKTHRNSEPNSGKIGHRQAMEAASEHLSTV
jgi:hypothetical protein